MKLLNIWISLTIILATAFLIIGCNNNDHNDVAENNATEGVGKTTSYLFVQNATSGTFVSNGDETYTLTMNGVSSQTIYFSDRPERKVGQIEMQTFLDTMCFASPNPPNAAIEIMNGAEDNDVIIAELLNPVYNNNAATLQYTARILKDANHSIADFNERNDVSIPTSFESVALFIDDCSDITVQCASVDPIVKYGKHYDGDVVCCTCFSWGSCDFQSDCCSFKRCQSSCQNKYGDGSRWLGLKNGQSGWFDNADDWNKYY